MKVGDPCRIVGKLRIGRLVVDGFGAYMNDFADEVAIEPAYDREFSPLLDFDAHDSCPTDEALQGAITGIRIHDDGFALSADSLNIKWTPWDWALYAGYEWAAKRAEEKRRVVEALDPQHGKSRKGPSREYR